jgi:hypothetical protein
MFGRNVSCVVTLVMLAACGSSTPMGKPIENGYRSNEVLTRSVTGQPMRTGTLESGRRYQITPSYTRIVDRGGSVSWNSRCEKDAMSDRLQCTYTHIPAHIFALRTQSGKVTDICILGHDFPGRRGAVRIDSNNHLPSNTDGCLSRAASQAFQKQLQNGGQRISTRYVEWPYDFPVDGSHLDAGAFSEIVALTQWQNQHTDLFH